MVLSPKQANKVLALVTNMDAHEAFLELLQLIKESSYLALLSATDVNTITALQGQLRLVEDLRDIRDRVKDSINNGN